MICTIKRRWKAGFLLLFATLTIDLRPLSSLSKSDPYPVYKALDPHEYLFTRQKMLIKQLPLELPYPQCMGFSISPFGENACVGKNFCGERSPLGDLTGRWNMIGLLYDPLPAGVSLPPYLQEARDALFPPAQFPPGSLTDEVYIDPARLFGFFSVPLDYKRRGLRFELSAMLLCNVGVTLQTGVADIVQKQVGFDNLTCFPCITQEAKCPEELIGPCCCGRIIPTETQQIICCGRSAIFSDQGPSFNTNFNTGNVNRYLMYEFANIMEEIGLDICNFHETSLEDIRLLLFWRDAYYINKGMIGWPEFLFCPYMELGGSIATGKKADPNVAFSLPFGNNGHHSLGGLAGINLDFLRTVEIGAEVGLTHFFSRDQCNMRVPNGTPSRYCQSGVYPFTTDVYISPGFNWHFGAKMSAYHFLDRCSFSFQYIFEHHESDTIVLKRPDPAFRPELLERSSYWTVQLANVALYYDISPSFSIGILWQTPLSQRNAYRTTTVLFSLNATY